jgi:hypothetical protein
MRRGLALLLLAGCGRTALAAEGSSYAWDPPDATVGVIVTEGFQIETRSRTCEGVRELDRELAAVREIAGELGLDIAFHFEDRGGIDFDDVAQHDVVVYHDGGWSNPGEQQTLRTLRALADAGRPLLFMGDDVAKHASRSAEQYGDPTLFQLAELDVYVANGIFGDGTTVVDADHPVMDGPAGVVSAFEYARDIDLAANGERATTLMDIEGSGWPAVWVTEIDLHRTMVTMTSSYTAAACPVSDDAGLASLHALVGNGLLWLLRESG